jgi:hypothetical protein
MSPNSFEDEVAAREHGRVHGGPALRSRAFELCGPRSSRKAGLIHVLDIIAYADRRG